MRYYLLLFTLHLPNKPTTKTMDIIEYQVKVKHHEKAIEILDAIIALEKRQVSQREWLATPLGQWCSQAKTKHQIEITDMAIARLNKYYINHVSKLINENSNR